jgi:hypothetical protein
MAPRIPLELSQAREARDEAWKLYDEAIEREGTEMIAERFKVCTYLEARCNDLYNQWQAMGGTSDIETLTSVELASKLEIVPFPQCQELSLNLVENTTPVFHATREWTKRHLNVEGNGFEGALDKAFGAGKWTLT